MTDVFTNSVVLAGLGLTASILAVPLGWASALWPVAYLVLVAVTMVVEIFGAAE